MNEALKNILERNSPRELTKPYPSKEEMEIIVNKIERGQKLVCHHQNLRKHGLSLAYLYLRKANLQSQ